jgi:hypothetical protein
MYPLALLTVACRDWLSSEPQNDCARMGFLQKTFLHRLWRHSKPLCIGLSAFFLLTIFFNLRGDEATPFLVFGMYSEKEKAPREFELLKIVVNDSLDLGTNRFSIYQKPFVKMPLQYYAAIRANGGIDPNISFLKEKFGLYNSILQPLEERIFNAPDRIDLFFPWYARYLGGVLDMPVRSIDVLRTYVHYAPDQSVVIDSTKPFARWTR